MLAEIALFASFYRERAKVLRRLDLPATRKGEGLVIASDGLGYYAWLRSLLIDGDWTFDDEFDDHNPLGDFVPARQPRTDAGRRPNPWSVGPACAWAITIVPLHATLVALASRSGDPSPDGYELAYQGAVGLTSLGASLVGLLLLYGICRHFAPADRAALAAAVMTLGTTVVYYSAIEVSMAHGLGTAAVAALVFCWLKTFGSERSGRWLGLGLLIGLAALMRWQLATLAVLPVCEAIYQVVGLRRRAGPILARLVLASLGAVAAFLPQLVAWKCVYGHWLASPFPVAHNWTDPNVSALLWGWDRGLFYWTPAVLLALAGYGVLIIGLPDRQDRWAGLMLLAAWLLHVYVLASLWGNQLYLGVAFGFRHLTESVILMAPGLALLFCRMPARWLTGIVVIGAVLVFWNLLLIAQFRQRLVPPDAGASPWLLLDNAWLLFTTKPLVVLTQAVLVPAGLLLAWWLPGKPPGGQGGRFNSIHLFRVHRPL
jgi:hypothetical protein